MSQACTRFAEPRTPRDHLVLPLALQCVSFSAGRDLRQSLPPHFAKEYTNSSSDLHLVPRAEASQPPSRATQSGGEPAFGVEKLRCVSWGGQAMLCLAVSIPSPRLPLTFHLGLCEHLCARKCQVHRKQAPDAPCSHCSLSGRFSAPTIPCSGLEQQSRGRSWFLFIHRDGRKEGEPGSMCTGIRIDWGLVINLFRP